MEREGEGNTGTEFGNCVSRSLGPCAVPQKSPLVVADSLHVDGVEPLPTTASRRILRIPWRFLCLDQPAVDGADAWKRVGRLRPPPSGGEGGDTEGGMERREGGEEWGVTSQREKQIKIRQALCWQKFKATWTVPHVR